MIGQQLFGLDLLIIIITLRHTILGRTPLDECSARRRDLYLKTHNTHNRQTDIRATGCIKSRKPSQRAAAYPNLRPRERRAESTILRKNPPKFYLRTVHVTKHTYNRIWTFTEKVTREKYGLVA
jgi:hypothetical protein